MGRRRTNADYDYSAEAPALMRGRIVWDKCNVCKTYEFRTLPDGRIDMADFRAHKASHGDVVKKKYTHGA